jgi:cohesin loading factor subunit SCC2
VEDIFEAEDTLPPDISPDDLPIEFFSSLTFDSSHALLHRTVIDKLTKLILKSSTRHSRQSTREAANGSPKKLKSTFATLETGILSRLLRILERSVKSGEDVDPFRIASVEPATIPARGESSPKKSPRKKAVKNNDRMRSKSATPHNVGEVEGHDTAESVLEPPNDVDVETLLRALEMARDSLLATDCCLTLLSSDRLQKQVSTYYLVMKAF